MSLNASAALQVACSLPPDTLADQAGDARWRIVDQKRIAHHRSGKGFGGRITRQIRRRHAKPILAIRKRSRIPAPILLPHLVLQQLPIGLMHTADLHGIDQAVAIIVGGGPTRANKALGILHRGRSQIERQRRSRSAGGLTDGRKRQGLRRRHRNRRHGEFIIGRRGLDGLDARRHVALQIRHIHRFELGRLRASGREDCFPLDETRRGHRDASALPMLVTGADHGLQFFCGRSRFPLRAAIGMLPPFRLAS